MSYIPKTISEVTSEYLNRTTFLPAIQREFVWGTYQIEKLFDSIMGDFPISTFLFWKIKEEKKKEWTAYALGQAGYADAVAPQHVSDLGGPCG